MDNHEYMVNMPKYMDNISIYFSIIRINTMKYMDNINILIYQYKENMKIYG